VFKTLPSQLQQCNVSNHFFEQIRIKMLNTKLCMSYDCLGTTEAKIYSTIHNLLEQHMVLGMDQALAHVLE
jgi:hypothetical protein